MNRLYFSSCFLLLFISVSSGQTNLSGVINQYTAVTEISEDCLTRIEVNDTTGFHKGAAALIIQMQGAEISINNDDGFGNVLGLRGTGSFEQIRVDSLDGQHVFFKNKLARNYNPQIGTVQLVTIPEFDNAVITDTLRPLPWDGSTGGIVILKVSNTLSLQAPIIASAMGFRGGIARSNLPNDCSWFNISNNQYYNIDNWRGAMKGEGIAVYVEEREAGRGPQANGGGGGNAHAGGKGGENEEPSTFGCKGPNPGRGGLEMTQNADLLFMGGGGGAGHGNNDAASDGGHGGGIIIVMAKTIEANSQPIAANGAAVPENVGDGAGGGGAAGVIALLTEDLNGVPRIELNGGNGGDVNNNNADRCFGPGGGGSPGFFMIHNNILTVDFDLRSSAGQAGRSYNSRACNAGSNGAEASTDMARLLRKDILPISDIQLLPEFTSNIDTFSLCENASDSWQLSADGFGLNYQWQWNRGSGWENVPLDAIHQPLNNQLSLNNVPLSFDGSLYRLQATDQCGQSITSLPTFLRVLGKPTASFNTSINNTAVTFTNTSNQANSSSWDFGDGDNSNDPNPTHTYPGNGQYTVQLIVTNNCGADTIEQVITIDILSAPSAAFSASPLSGCAPLQVQFTDQSSANTATRNWLFPGGTPASSTAVNPVVTYSSPGNYNVRFEVSNAAGTDGFQQIAYISVRGKPAADFTFNINGRDLSLTNNSVNATSYLWDFGDNQTSMQAAPSHNYITGGQYTVQLIARNDCGNDTSLQVVTVPNIAAPTAGFSSSATQGCAPFSVTFTDNSAPDIQQRSWRFPGGIPATSTEVSPSVYYADPGSYTVELEVTNAAGMDILQQQDYIEVIAQPRAVFDFQLLGDTLILTNLSTNAVEFRWSFGDGNSSMEASPVHIYGSSGTYRVTLVAKNLWCSSVVSIEVPLIISSTADLAGKERPMVYPNPTASRLWIKWSDTGLAQRSCRLYAIAGQLIWEKEEGLNDLSTIELGALEQGLYLLEMWEGDWVWWEKVVVR